MTRYGAGQGDIHHCTLPITRVQGVFVGGADLPRDRAV